MLQELATLTGSTAWAVGSLLFFTAVWVAIAVWVFRARSEEMEAKARLVFDRDEAHEGAIAADNGTKA